MEGRRADVRALSRGSHVLCVGSVPGGVSGGGGVFYVGGVSDWCVLVVVAIAAVVQL